MRDNNKKKRVCFIRSNNIIIYLLRRPLGGNGAAAGDDNRLARMSCSENLFFTGKQTDPVSLNNQPNVGTTALSSAVRRLLFDAWTFPVVSLPACVC